jgi:hypothetical protein
MISSTDKKGLEELLNKTNYHRNDLISTTEYRANFDGTKHYDKNSV